MTGQPNQAPVARSGRPRRARRCQAGALLRRGRRALMKPATGCQWAAARELGDGDGTNREHRPNAMTRRAAQAWHGRQRSVAKAPMAGTGSSNAKSTVHIRGCDAILLYSYRLSREHCRFRSDRRPTGAAESAPPVTAAQGYFAISQQCCESVVRPAIAYRGATSTAAGALLQGKGTEGNGSGHRKATSTQHASVPPRR
jgi:hypothetical protein